MDKTGVTERGGPSGRRREIALAALAVFLERGYVGTSMARVAREAGVTKSALYHHFATKEEMFVAALAADADASLAALDALAAQSDRPADARLREALGHAHDAVLTGSMGRLVMVLAQTGRDVPEVARGFHDTVIVRFRRAMRAIYADAAASGTHRSLPARDVDQIVFGPLLSNAVTANLVAGASELHEANLAGTDREGYIAMIERLTRQA